MPIRPVRQRQRPVPPKPAFHTEEAYKPELSPPTAAALAGEQTSRSYEVGYGKPPIHSRFKPGQSGNPKGRPKDAKGLKTLAREILTKKVPVRTAAGQKKISRIEVAIEKTFELAAKGNAKALGEVLKLYSAAVPDVAPISRVDVVEDLTETDLAILEALKLQLLAAAGDRE